MDNQPPAPEPAGTPPGDALPPAPPAPEPPAPEAMQPPPAAAMPPAPVSPAPAPPAPAAVPPAWQAAAAPTGPAPGVEFAGYGARLVAYVIDWFIIGLAVAILWVIIAVVAQNDDNAFITAVLVGATVLIWLLYFPYFWHRSGQTPGMTPFDIRVVRDRDGGPIGWLSAFLRLIGYSIDSIILGLPIGYLWVFVDKRRRAWHDLIGSTVVIRD